MNPIFKSLFSDIKSDIVKKIQHWAYVSGAWKENSKIPTFSILDEGYLYELEQHISHLPEEKRKAWKELVSLFISFRDITTPTNKGLKNAKILIEQIGFDDFTSQSIQAVNKAILLLKKAFSKDRPQDHIYFLTDFNINISFLKGVIWCAPYTNSSTIIDTIEEFAFCDNPRCDVFLYRNSALNSTLAL